MVALRRIIIFLLTIAALTACGDNITKPIDVPVTVALTPDSLLLTVGQTQLVSAAVGGSTQKATFTSSNTNVATVDSLGLVTALAGGTTFVRAVVGTARDSSKVIVTAITGTISVAPKAVTLLVGASQPLSVTVQGPITPPTFTSSNTAVATVNNLGVVTATGAGTTHVVASIGPLRDSARISVVAPVNAPVQLARLGTGLVPERFSAEITVANGFAYTTTWSTRPNGAPGNAVKIWNVMGNTPILTDSLILAGAGTTSDVQISDDGKLLAVSTEGGTSSARGFALFDRTVSPGKPTFVTRYNSAATSPGVHTLKFTRIDGRHYLLLQIDPPAALVIVDITNPGAPVEVLNRRMGNPFIHDVFVRDGVLFAGLWNDGVAIFDIGGVGAGGSVSNPLQLGILKTAACPGCGTGTSSVHNIWWFNDPRTGSKRYAFIGEEGPSSAFTSSRGDIHVVDVSDFRNPREVAFFRPDSATTSTGFQPAGTHNFDVDEQSGILYAAYYNGGVRALDIRGDLGTCTAEQKSADGRCNLRLMGREVGIGLTTTPVYIWGVKLDGNFLYASDMPNGIHKLNIAALKR